MLGEASDGSFQLRTNTSHSHDARPSDAAWQQLISTLHASGRKAALAITGGGSGAIGELLRVPGGSRLLIEAQVPYDAQALAAFLGLHRHRQQRRYRDRDGTERSGTRGQGGAGGHRSGWPRRDGGTGQRSPA
jgi:hypothetical protein